MPTISGVEGGTKNVFHHDRQDCTYISKATFSNFYASQALQKWIKIQTGIVGQYVGCNDLLIADSTLVSSPSGKFGICNQKQSLLQFPL